VAGVMRKSWAVEQCLEYFGLTREDAHFIASRAGQQHLAALHMSDPAAFYEHPLQILRQEVWHQISYSTFFEQYGFWHAVSSTGVILDFGCGTAETARLPWIMHGHGYIGVDASQAVRDYTRHKYRGKEFIIFESLDRVTRHAVQFDGLVCTDCFEHVVDPIALTETLWEYLRPGGHALFRFSDAFPHPGHLQESIVQIPEWYRWICEHSEVIEIGTFLWTQKHS
jgi:SAM-dependent methyltransferase